MASYLLDTNHVSPLVTLTHPLRERIMLALHNGDAFASCVPVVAETCYGIGLLPRAKRNLAEWNRLKPKLTIYVPDVEDAEKAAALQIILRKQGKQLETIDALIAIVALRYDLTLLTTDSDFDAVPQLQRDNWISATTTKPSAITNG